MSKKSTLAFFWKHIKPYRGWYAIMLIAPVVGSAYPLFYNYSIKLLLDTIVENPTFTYHDVLLPIGMFITIQIVLEINWRFSDVIKRKAEPKVRRSILLQAYDYVQHHSYTFFQNNFTGAISSKIKGLLDGYDKFWEEMHFGLFQKTLKVLINLAALFIVNRYLGLFVSIWMLLFVPLMYVLSQKLNARTFTMTESKHGLLGQISDNFLNIMTIFSYARRKEELKKLDTRISSDYIPKQICVYKFSALLHFLSGIFHFFLMGFIVFYMIHLRKTHQISIGDFTLVFGLTMVTMEELWAAMDSLQSFIKSMGDFRSSLTILNLPQQSLDTKKAKPIVIQNPSIEFKALTFGYNDHDGKAKKIFDQLSFSIKAGEKIGIVGRSGAGKSSLIHLLLRYFTLDQGQILVNGYDINQVQQDSLRAQIAVIPQDTMLFHRSILENIRYGKEGASDEEVIEASKKAHIHEFIMSLPEKYHTFVGERGIKLSGGQRQRISIARAILKNAPILILDEATSALDSETEHLVQKSLLFLIKNKQRTVIAIAHRLSTLNSMDRLIVLDKGKIVEEGTHEQLLKKPRSFYKELWDYQSV